MAKRIACALALAASAAALAQPAAARDTGLYGDWRQPCAGFMVSGASQYQAHNRPALPPQLERTLYWDTQTSQPHFFGGASLTQRRCHFVIHRSGGGRWPWGGR
jgi:hypothetical protein